MGHKTGWEAHQSVKQAERRSSFFKQLEELNSKVRAAEQVEQVVAGMTGDICALFGCDRLTLYVVSPSKTAIESRIKTGMDSFKNFSLPIAHSSIAGHVALTRRSYNIQDVYDEAELRAHSPDLRFLDKVDRRISYRTREMITAPIVNARNGELLGVLQLINNRLGGPFPTLIADGAREFCKALAEAFDGLAKAPLQVHTRFDALIALGSLSTAELELAKRFARRKKFDLEEVLIDAFKVGLDQLGAAYSHFFRVPYEPFRPDRKKSKLLQTIKREYASHNGWLVLEDMGPALTVLALEPDRLKATRRVQEVFPKHAVQFRVTTHREFLQTLDHFYGAQPGAAQRKADAALLERIQNIVSEALASAAPELQAVVRSERSRVTRDDTGDGTATVSIELGCRSGPV